MEYWNIRRSYRITERIFGSRHSGSACSYFTSNRIKLSEYGLKNDIERINYDLVGLSKRAVTEFLKEHPDQKAYVSADLSMTGQQLEPMGQLSLETLIDVYKEQLQYVAAASVDLITIETMMSLQECRRV